MQHTWCDLNSGSTTAFMIIDLLSVESSWYCSQLFSTIICKHLRVISGIVVGDAPVPDDNLSGFPICLKKKLKHSFNIKKNNTTFNFYPLIIRLLDSNQNVSTFFINVFKNNDISVHLESLFHLSQNISSINSSVSANCEKQNSLEYDLTALRIFFENMIQGSTSP